MVAGSRNAASVPQPKPVEIVPNTVHSERDPFVPCFSGRAHLFATRVLSEERPGDLIPEHVARKALIAYFNQAAFDKAAFALYVDYRRSELSYDAWLADIGTHEHIWDILFAQYKTLADELAELESRLAKTWRCFTRRLQSDHDALRQFFGFGLGATVSALDLSKSDPHDGHQTVVQIDMSDGVRFLYKPRGLEIDEAWTTLLDNTPTLDKIISARSMACVGYGYQSYIESDPQPVLDHESARASGQLLAVAWLLNSSDLHADNVVFSEGLIGLYDLETILTPVLSFVKSSESAWRENDVNATLFICTDVSGVSAQSQSSAVAALLRRAEEDALFFQVNAKGKVRPRPKAKFKTDPRLVADPSYVDAMVRSFRSTATNGGVRSALSEFVTAIEHLPIRFVPRDTAEYYNMLLELNLPRFLRDPGLRSAYFAERIETASRFDSSSLSPNLAQLVQDEFAQTARGDIPMFRVLAGGRALCLSDGTGLPLFALSGADNARDKLAFAGQSDVEEQTTLIAASLGQADLPWRPTKARTSKTTIDMLAQRILQTASVADGHRARWFSVGSGIPPAGSHAMFGELSGLKGSLGILRALQAYLSVNYGKPNVSSVQDFLDREAELFRFEVAAGNERASRIIGLEGVAGDLLCASHLFQLDPCRWRSIKPYCDALLNELLLAVPQASNLDVMGGHAGVILALGQVVRLAPELLKRCEEVTAQSATMLRKTIESDDAAFDDIGFAHGWAGAFAAASIAKDLELQQCLGRKLAEIYDQFGYWPDLRLEQPSPLNDSWCNGSVGVWRAQAVAADLVDCPLPDMPQSWTPESSDGLGARFCCGAAGLMDLFLDQAEFEQAAQVEKHIVSTYLTPSSGFDPSFEQQTQNLYYGTAGMLYTSLRRLDNELPSLSLT